MTSSPDNIVAIVPCFRCKSQILDVLKRFPPIVSKILVVDDGCPEKTGRWVADRCQDPRVEILYHETNQGVGGAVRTGYQAGLRAGADILVKVDGDGQMDPELIGRLVQPLRNQQADYAKGNRFFHPRTAHHMPWLRLIGNGVLSFWSKAATGYWNVMDPTNGFTAIHQRALRMVDPGSLDSGYYFETDLLARLRLIQAVVVDVPMTPVYGEEQSNLKIRRVAPEFSFKLIRTTLKRLGFMYLIRDFNVATIEALVGLFLVVAGTTFGLYHWYRSLTQGIPATSGTVMLSALPVVLGFQLLLSAVGYDVRNIPTVALQRSLRGDQEEGVSGTRSSSQKSSETV